MSEISTAEKLYKKSKHRKGYKSIYQLYIKRLIDIVLSLIVLPFALLLMLPIAFAVKVSDGGPILYKSKRLGIGFREFDMLKFRSMKVNAPDIRNADGSTYNSKNDERVTKIGKLLRETSLDEIPQLFNIIKGEMSIIGPRAGDVESKDTYADDEKDKLLVRPGVSGYTQAYYRNSIGVREKRLFDAAYAHNVNFLLDLKILVHTAITVIRRKDIYTN